MRVTINVNGQDLFASDVIQFLNMLAFRGETQLALPEGAVVVMHAEANGERITEKTIISYEDDLDD